MQLVREQDGTWSLKIETEADKVSIERSHASYPEALPRYVAALELAFTKAAETSEFALISTLLRVRGLQDAGWDPYETSLQAISQIRGIHQKIGADQNIESFYAARHLQLWIYGHIVEASEPYEILANLIAISQGETFNIDRFPARNGRPQSPGAKIDQLEKAASEASLPSVVTPLKEVWDRELRNAIFHSDYSLHGDEFRFRKDGLAVKYDHDKILTLVNRALAYFDALEFLHSRYIGSYTQPSLIPTRPQNAAFSNEQAIVMVRQGHGAIGLKHAWTPEELKRGHIPWSYGRFSLEEMEQCRADPERAFFPAKNCEKPASMQPEQELEPDHAGKSDRRAPPSPRANSR